MRPGDSTLEGRGKKETLLLVASLLLVVGPGAPRGKRIPDFGGQDFELKGLPQTFEAMGI